VIEAFGAVLVAGLTLIASALGDPRVRPPRPAERLFASRIK
jgi:hypothetical protein